jgi:hypothetical protein
MLDRFTTVAARYTAEETIAPRRIRIITSAHPE